MISMINKTMRDAINLRILNTLVIKLLSCFGKLLFSFSFIFNYSSPFPLVPLIFILHSSFFILHSSFFILHSSLFILHSSFFTVFNCPFLYKPQTSILYPSLLTIFPHFVLRTSYLVLRSMQLSPDRKILELIAALRGDNGLYPEVMREDQ